MHSKHINWKFNASKVTHLWTRVIHSNHSNSCLKRYGWALFIVRTFQKFTLHLTNHIAYKKYKRMHIIDLTNRLNKM